jgi:hypothetical protein
VSTFLLPAFPVCPVVALSPLTGPLRPFLRPPLRRPLAISPLVGDLAGLGGFAGLVTEAPRPLLPVLSGGVPPPAALRSCRAAWRYSSEVMRLCKASSFVAVLSLILAGDSGSWPWVGTCTEGLCSATCNGAEKAGSGAG